MITVAAIDTAVAPKVCAAWHIGRAAMVVTSGSAMIVTGKTGATVRSCRGEFVRGGAGELGRAVRRRLAGAAARGPLCHSPSRSHSRLTCMDLWRVLMGNTWQMIVQNGSTAHSPRASCPSCSSSRARGRPRTSLRRCSPTRRRARRSPRTLAARCPSTSARAGSRRSRRSRPHESAV